MPILIPELLWSSGGFERGLALEYDAVAGRILRIGAVEALVPGSERDGGGQAAGRAEAGHAAAENAGRTGQPHIESLPGRALLPGFVNAHSHAFQRLIRGHTQWRPAARPNADFWSWRETMYRAALTISPEQVEAVARFCFLEMLCAGYTSVGEFHYLHRDPDGGVYGDPNELAGRVIAAANDVGIRIALLNVCYATGAIGEPLAPEQRRFATPDLDEYLSATEALLSARPPLATIGVAPHSVRAVPREWLGPLHAWAAARDVAFHIHAAEQPLEVEQCLEAYGVRPIELLADADALDDRTTVIHATHLSETEPALVGSRGATVCACPTTERDLGDGFLPGKELLDAGARIALGSDSQTVIDPFEEMRLIEYHERLRGLERAALAVPAGRDRLEVAPRLLDMATRSGAAALRLDSGRLEPGALADFVAVDLGHRTLAGWTPDSLAAVLTLSAHADVVRGVWVGGTRRVENGRHTLDADARAEFRTVTERVIGS